MKTYGCIGKQLTHSFSKEIHAALADYEYRLMELSEEQIPAFFADRDFAAINVTIPYKETVIPYLDEISPVAQRIGAVNTVVNRGGKLFGYNTDYYGMKALLERVGLELKGKKVLVPGSGGTGKMARVLALDLGASQVLSVSRGGGEGLVTYEEAAAFHSDAQILINTTPVGMYPACKGSPVDPEAFPALEGLIDAVYNPLCTDLVLKAKAKGLKAQGGLYMLVMQAVAAVERFLDRPIPPSAADEVYAKVLSQKENIVLTGMPGSGKSTVARCLAAQGLRMVDCDEEIAKRAACSIRELIATKGEGYFRDLESLVVEELSAQSGLVIATGGGAILREENCRALKRNGRLYFLDAPLSRLKATKDRPLSDSEEKLKKLYEERLPIYRASADVIVPEGDGAEDSAHYILQKRRELLG